MSRDATVIVMVVVSLWCRCHFRHTVFPLIEAGSIIQARGQTSFVLIEAGSLLEAGGGSKGEYHRTNCTSPGSTVVHCVIRAYCVISRTAVWRPKKKRSSNTSRVSNTSRGSDTIEAGGNTVCHVKSLFKSTVVHLVSSFPGGG